MNLPETVRDRHQEHRTDRLARRTDLRLRAHELPLLVGLIVMWMMLWKEISVLSSVSGLLAAIVATRMVYLPPVDLGGRFNAFAAAKYVGYFVGNVVVASFHVAWLSIRPGAGPTPAIVQVRLRTQSDFILTMTGLTMSLIPGSVIVDVDRFGSTLYLHAIDAPTEQDRETLRNEVLAVEAMLIHTIGSKAELELVK